MERALCIIVQNQNYKIYGNKVDYIRHFKYRKIEKTLNELSALNLYKHNNIILNKDYVLKNLEMSFILDYNISKVKIKDLKYRDDKDLLHDLKEYKIKNLNVTKNNNKDLIIVNQNNEIINDISKINILEKVNNYNNEINVIKINIAQINFNKIKPFSNKITYY